MAKDGSAIFIIREFLKAARVLQHNLQPQANQDETSDCFDAAPLTIDTAKASIDRPTAIVMIAANSIYVRLSPAEGVYFFGSPAC